MKTMTRRRIHATDAAKDSDSEDERERVYRDDEFSGGGGLPQDFIEIMHKQVAAMIESIDAGGSGGSGSPHVGGGGCRV